MLEELLAKSESKTLEFKENAHNLFKIVQTVIAFANTAGGMLVIGIEDRPKMSLESKIFCKMKNVLQTLLLIL